MDAITYTEARKNFTKSMNIVCNDHSPIIITRQNQKPVVMMSLEDYNSIKETLYLIKSPKNAIRLSKAMREVEKGIVCNHALVE